MNQHPLTVRTLVTIALIAIALAGCTTLQMRSAEPPRVSITSLTLTNFALFEQRFAVGLRLQNPNNFPIPISGFDYTLSLDGENFAEGVNDTAVTVPAMGEEELVVSVSSNLLDSLDQFRRWQDDPPDALDYQLTGRVQVADVPVSLPFDYGGSVDLDLAGR